MFKCRNPSVLFSSPVTETHRPHEMNKMKKMGPKVQESDGDGGEGENPLLAALPAWCEGFAVHKNTCC